ncbi:hypothetical protein H0H93_006480 [Arthromyces matolae]|nr:hypothetical protein H0H93_006480 [Arthromyces matolae]
MSSKAARREKFEGVFELIRNSLVEDCGKEGLPAEALDWYRANLDYNVPGGKLNRGLSVIDTAEILKGRPLSEDEYLQAAVLGWSVELEHALNVATFQLQAYFLVADDIMDSSITRRSQPCWYLSPAPAVTAPSSESITNSAHKHPAVGMIAINDSFMLNSSIYHLLRKHFKSHPRYIDLVDLFHDITYKTEMGQLVDLVTAPEGVVDLARFSLERHRLIVTYKTAYYSFHLPVALAMLMCNIPESYTVQLASSTTSLKPYDLALSILIPLGEYFQVQDDFLDFSAPPEVLGKIGTDIVDNKCSWCVNTVMGLCTPAQRLILDRNYGRKGDIEAGAEGADTEQKTHGQGGDAGGLCEKRVKELYEVVGLRKVYAEYEAGVYKRLNELIDSIPEDGVVIDENGRKAEHQGMKREPFSSPTWTFDGDIDVDVDGGLSLASVNESFSAQTQEFEIPHPRQAGLARDNSGLLSQPVDKPSPPRNKSPPRTIMQPTKSTSSPRPRHGPSLEAYEAFYVECIVGRLYPYTHHFFPRRRRLEYFISPDYLDYESSWVDQATMQRASPPSSSYLSHLDKEEKISTPSVQKAEDKRRVVKLPQTSRDSTDIMQADDAAFIKELLHTSNLAKKRQTAMLHAVRTRVRDKVAKSFDVEMFGSAQLSPILRPLLLLIKIWAKPRGLNNPQSQAGHAPPSFNSYALTLMTIGFLQTRGWLPNLQADLPPFDPEERGSAYWLESKAGAGAATICDIRYHTSMGAWVSPPLPPVRDILHDWFTFWSKEFRFGSATLSIRSGQILDGRPDKKDALYVLDPFIADKNVARSVSGAVLELFIHECDKAASDLRAGTYLRVLATADKFFSRKLEKIKLEETEKIAIP